eukprot:COSAG02_NODE_1061_length_14864_cov_7.878090_3_plen_889_part_00
MFPTLVDENYIDQGEFDRYLNSSAANGLQRSGSCPHAENCCWPGFTGPLCEFCIDDPPNTTMKIGGACVRCEGTDVGRLVLGAFGAFLFTLFIMHKASTTFQEANGTATIAIFYFQIVGLLFRDRAVQFGWLIVSLFNIFDLGFARSTESSCVFYLSFYPNFYYSIFSTVIVVVICYAVMIGLTALTATVTHLGESEMVDAGELKRTRIVTHVLSHMPIFNDLHEKQLEAVADAMTVHKKMPKHYKVKEAGQNEGLFVIVISGECTVDGKSHDNSATVEKHFREGQHFGEHALLGHEAEHIDIRVSKWHTTVMTLSKPAFMAIKVDGEEIYQKVLTKAEQLAHTKAEPLAHDEDTVEVDRSFGKYDQDAVDYIDRDQAEKLFIDRHFDLSADPSADFVGMLCDNLDSNGDGRISRVKFTDVLRQADELKDHFRQFDKDQSDMIERAELGLLIKACGQPVPVEAELKQLEATLDANGSGHINFQDFCDFMLRESLRLEKAEKRVAGLTKKHLFETQQTDMDDTEHLVEVEDQIGRAMVHTFQMTAQKRNVTVTRQIVVTHSWFWQVQRVLKMANVEIMRIYEACSNATARQCAALEMAVALYGPLTLYAMSMLFCRELDGDRVLVVDSTQRCDESEGSDYRAAKNFAVIFLLALGIGTPLTMWYAALSFYETLDHDLAIKHHAKHVAKTRHHSTWKTMKKKQRNDAINACMFELRMEMLSAHSFLLTSFQMSVSQSAAYWYPQWHLLRRTIINFLYFEGLRNGNGQIVIVGDYKADWRVLMVVLLAVSDLLQIRFDIFRMHSLDVLEMWSLHFLLVVVVIDIANEDISFYLCLILSGIFAVLVVIDYKRDRDTEHRAGQQWNKLQTLQFTGKLGNNVVSPTARGEFSQE